MANKTQTSFRSNSLSLVTASHLRLRQLFCREISFYQ